MAGPRARSARYSACRSVPVGSMTNGTGWDMRLLLQVTTARPREAGSSDVVPRSDAGEDALRAGGTRQAQARDASALTRRGFR
ncbi:hypothetical protein Sru01_67200 [Sphaerisporangium rufum]|uniref:Uncharacterized protein n=1 Tax=Sphaerisporangium rufum TaxID=1381558 RepID=A0A919R9J3_9ACTN|nr:hypothetical protein Sru01_67200 [Sphaerisporangium rufum]